jgi:C4-dicarboxylate-binding protein DctP
MKTKNWRLLCILLAVFLGQFVCFSGPVGAAESKMTLRMVGFLPLGHQITKTEELFIKEVQENSKGVIEIKHYPAQQLYNHKNSVPVLQKGGVELALVQTGFWTGVVPSISVCAFLTYYNNFDHFRGVLDGYPGQIFRKDFEEKGNLKVLTWANYGPLEICSKTPLKTLEDFKGRRLRAPGGDFAVWVKGVGAGPVTMNSGEVYQALQRGTVDGAISGPSSFDQRKWYEVNKYMTDSALSPVYAYFMLLHVNTWKKLSPELQKVFMDAAKKAHDFNIKACDEEDRVSREKLLKMGMVANKISTKELGRWRAKGLPALIKTYKERVGAEKAQKILDAVEDLRKKFE